MPSNAVSSSKNNNNKDHGVVVVQQPQHGAYQYLITALTHPPHHQQQHLWWTWWKRARSWTSRRPSPLPWRTASPRLRYVLKYISTQIGVNVYMPTLSTRVLMLIILSLSLTHTHHTQNIIRVEHKHQSTRLCVFQRGRNGRSLQGEMAQFGAVGWGRCLCDLPPGDGGYGAVAWLDLARDLFAHSM